MNMATEPDSETHARSLHAAVWTPFPLAVLMVILRFYARYRRRSIGTEDWIMLCALILHTVSLGIANALITYGSLRDVSMLSAERLTWITRTVVIVFTIGLWAVMLGKVAVGLLILRLLTGYTTYWRQSIIWFSITVGVALSVVNSFATFFQCDPPNALWEQRDRMCPRTAFFVDISIVQSSVGVWLDFLLALLPGTFVFKLRMPLRKKIAVCMLLGLGLFAGICGIMKILQYKTALVSSDPAYASYWLFFWTSLEIAFVIIAGSIAPAKPVFDQVFFGKPIRTGPFDSVIGSGFSSMSSAWHWRIGGFQLPGSNSSISASSSKNSNQVLPVHGKNRISISKTFGVESMERA